MVSIADPFIAHEVLGTKGSLAANRPYDKFMTKIYSRNGRFVKCKEAEWDFSMTLSHQHEFIVEELSLPTQIQKHGEEHELFVSLVQQGLYIVRLFMQLCDSYHHSGTK